MTRRPEKDKRPSARAALWGVAAWAALGATLGAGSPALADEPQGLANEDKACPPLEAKTDKYRHLRALSLDLRGVPPSAQEYAALADLEDVPEAWIDQWLTSPEFASRVARWHKAQLWHNVTDQNPVAVNRGLTVSNQVYWRNGTIAIRLRGRNVSCLNEQAKLTDGTLVTQPSDLERGELEIREQSDGTRREGWTWVEPYWAPGAPIKVCALDARQAATTSAGAPCHERLTSADVECGCGPNLIWCATGTSRLAIMRSMGEQIDRLVAWVIQERRPYLELFTTKKTFVNGPLAYYWRHLWSVGSNIINEPNPMAQATLPELTFDQDQTWVETFAGEHAAGVLTAPAYLLRFQTDRARATQFYTKFRCQPFQPPNDGLKISEDTHPDLQQRDGCKYCHALLEPAASYWGRWREQSAGFLPAPEFPPISDACRSCAQTGRGCSADCRAHYVMGSTEAPMKPFAGHLNAYLFRKPEHHVNVERGPSLLAATSVADNSLLACITERQAEHLFGRPVLPAEREWLEAGVRELAKTDFDFASIVKRVVTSDTYRRVQ